MSTDDPQIARIERDNAHTSMTVVDDVTLSNGCRVVLSRHVYNNDESYFAERLAVFGPDGGGMLFSGRTKMEYGRPASEVDA